MIINNAKLALVAIVKAKKIIEYILRFFLNKYKAAENKNNDKGKSLKLVLSK